MEAGHAPKEQKQFRPFFLSVITSLGLSFGDVLLYPIDTLNTRIKANKLENIKFFKFARETFRSQGVMPLYKGWSTALYTSFLPSTIYFFIYETLTKMMQERLDRSPTWHQYKLGFPFLISCVSELAALSVMVPFETVRTRIQVKDPRYDYSGVFHALREISRKEGFFRLYRTSNLFMVYMLLYTGIQFQMYQTIRYYTEHTFYMTLINTLVSTVTVNVVVNPLEVLITRTALVDTTKKKLDIKNTVLKLRQREGVAGFYKGFTAKLASTVLYTLFWFPAYDQLRNRYGSNVRD